MIADLVIIPMGQSPHISDCLAKVLKTIDRSGLPYQLTPTATCVEGSWDEIMALAKKCHTVAREGSPHVFTFLRIEDDADASQQLQLRRNTESVEEKAEETFNKQPVEDAKREPVPATS